MPNTTSGLTWEEETAARLKDARQRQSHAQEMQKRADEDATQWGRYADTLQRALELDRHCQSMKSSVQYGLNPENLRKKSIREALIEIAEANNGLLVATEAVNILLDADIFGDRDQARGTLYATLSRSKRCFKKERPGIYRLVKKKSVPLAFNV